MIVSLLWGFGKVGENPISHGRLITERRRREYGGRLSIWSTINICRCGEAASVKYIFSKDLFEKTSKKYLQLYKGYNFKNDADTGITLVISRSLICTKPLNYLSVLNAVKPKIYACFHISRFFLVFTK